MSSPRPVHDAAGSRLVAALRQRIATAPSDVAIRADGQVVSFAELGDRLDRATARLRAEGARPGQMVLLELDRSIDAIVWVYAAWSLGIGYIPLDPTVPDGFREDMRAAAIDAGGSAILGTVRDESAEGGWWAPAAGEGEGTGGLMPAPREGDRPAYGIFTSGTSGARRCVVVGHEQVDALAAGLQQVVFATVADGPLRVAVNASLSFDASVQQIVQLAAGHALVLVPEAIRRDPRAMAAHLRAHEVDVVDVTPSMVRRWLADGMLASDGPLVRLLLVGGEEIDAVLWESLADLPGVVAFDVYGPTECTVDVTAGRITGPVPRLGEPLPHVLLTIEDGEGRAVDDYVIGEIVVSGPAVGWGYLGGEQGGFGGEGSGRRYATGDLARRHGDGSLEFVGRVDLQTKVAGVRVDLSEVEAVLRAVPGVDDAASAVNEAGAIVAAVVIAPEVTTSAEEIRDHLLDSIPLAFVPSDLVVVEQIPMTERGKVDRHAVVELAQDLGGPPQGEVEATVAELMAELVGDGSFERHESFFRRGGDSLGILELAARLGDMAGHEVDIAVLVARPTPAGVAELLATGLQVAASLTVEPSAADAAKVTANRPDHVTVVHHALGEAIACGELAGLDAAAIVCVPDVARSALGSGQDLRRLAGTLPILGAIRETADGRLGAVILPCYSSEAQTEGPALVERAIGMAATYGARGVSLTGDLGPATRFGQAIGCIPEAVALTTGQASTVAALVTNWEAACHTQHRGIAAERLVVLGQGVLPDALTAYVESLPVGPASVERITGPARLADVASATSIVACGVERTSLDVTRLSAGTVVVEYGVGWSEELAGGSSPVVVTEGGSLSSPAPIAVTVYAYAALHHLGTDLIERALDIDERALAACELAALLVAAGRAPAVCEAPGVDLVAAYREAQRALGYRALTDPG